MVADPCNFMYESDPGSKNNMLIFSSNILNGYGRLYQVENASFCKITKLGSQLALEWVNI